VVLVGAGHTHIQVLEAFARQPPPQSRLTVVVDVPISVYSGMVPGFVAGQYRSEQLDIDAEALALRAQAGIVLKPAIGVDISKRRIVLEGGSSLPYDLVSFDVGSTVAGLNLPGVREHTFPTRPIGTFNRRVAEIIEKARQMGSSDHCRLAVVGGGAGGVELAFTFHQRLKAEGIKGVRVLLVERGSGLLSGYSQSLIRRVLRQCQRRGIDVLYNCDVQSVASGLIRFGDGTSLPCQVIVWVTGAIGHTLFRDSGLATDKRGFLRIRSTLQAEHHHNIFAAGDCATLIAHPTTPKAGVYAVRQGPILINNLRAWLAGRSFSRYTPQKDFLTLLNLGGGTALGAKYGFSFEGAWVMKLKDWIDRRFMRRFQLSGG
jgi:selenide,water dikinase